MSIRTNIRKSVTTSPRAAPSDGADYERGPFRPGSNQQHIGAKRHPSAAERATEERLPINVLLQYLFAELIGSFALTFIASGTVMVGAISHEKVDFMAQVVAPGLIIGTLIYSMGDAGGAHYNPAVTFGFFLRGLFPLKRVLAYWAVQLAGGILAAWVLVLMFGDIKHVGGTLPEHGVTSAFLMEVIATAFYVLSNLGTATRATTVGPNAAIARGSLIAVDGLIAGPISGASMNPQRTLGPMIIDGKLEYAWLYIAAPLLGALIGAACMWVIHRKNDPKTAETVQGHPSHTSNI